MNTVPSSLLVVMSLVVLVAFCLGYNVGYGRALKFANDLMDETLERIGVPRKG